ncbi:hypothetical protein KUTeg_006190 [Tegillarca granosa]|uniref:VWFA domain-containing protein n=1 Tax=Tegillarca granosa TaxID=220873 RepID=A0ABQ9FFT2_TEGGR|nr:hypothetical protein KUTeg_006190 [Tegillarca granosa]
MRIIVHNIFNICFSAKDLLEYRNAIIVFSDGEINAGIQEPGKLVHYVREKIRNMSFGLDDSQNQWVTISVIATGNDVSETVYLLSKICSSEAFYHLDMESNNVNFDMYLPILMRKTAVVWNVSLLAETLNGARLINEECTQDCKIRLRYTVKGMERTKKAFFFYDMQASSKKHVGLTISMDNVCDDTSTEIANIRESYTSFSGKRKCTTRIIQTEDLQMEDEKKKQKIIEKNLMMDARTVSVIALQNAADNVRSGNIAASTADLEEGGSEVQKLCEKYGAMASTSEDVKLNINLYATSLMKNMENLLKAVQGITGDDNTNKNRQWAKIKTVSSAIEREVPTVSETVSNSNLLCPLPAIRDVSSPQTRQQIGNIYTQRGVRDSVFLENLNTILEKQQEKPVTMILNRKIQIRIRHVFIRLSMTGCIMVWRSPPVRP